MYSFTVNNGEIAESYSCIYFIGRNYDMKLTKSILEAPEEDDFYAIFPLLEDTLKEVEKDLEILKINQNEAFNIKDRTDPYNIRLSYGDKGVTRLIISDEIDVFCMLGLKVIKDVYKPTIHIKHNYTYRHLSFLYSMLKPAIFEYMMKIGINTTKDELTNTGSIQKSVNAIINQVKK